MAEYHCRPAAVPHGCCCSLLLVQLSELTSMVVCGQPRLALAGSPFLGLVPRNQHSMAQARVITHDRRRSSTFPLTLMGKCQIYYYPFSLGDEYTEGVEQGRQSYENQACPLDHHFNSSRARGLHFLVGGYPSTRAKYWSDVLEVLSCAPQAAKRWSS